MLSNNKQFSLFFILILVLLTTITIVTIIKLLISRILIYTLIIPELVNHF